MTNPLLVSIAFGCTALADLVWVRWHAAVAARRPHAAACWSVAIFALGSAFTLTVVEKDLVAYLAALAGAYCGTYWALKGE